MRDAPFPWVTHRDWEQRRGGSPKDTRDCWSKKKRHGHWAGKINREPCCRNVPPRIWTKDSTYSDIRRIPQCPPARVKAVNQGRLLPASRGHLAILRKSAPGSGGERPRMLLNIVQCSGQPPTTSHLTPNAYSAKVEKPWTREIMGFPGGSDGKESACDVGDPGSIPESRRSPREGNSYPFQYSYLENSMDRGVWWAQSTGSQRVGHDWENNIGDSASLSS